MLPTRKVMRKLIRGTRGIYVNVSCEFSFEDGTICELPQDSDGKVTIWLYDKEHKVTAQWLMLLAMFEIDDSECVDRVTFIEAPYVKNEKFRFRVSYRYPRWYDKSRDFRYVPGWPFVAVNRSGVCISTKTDSVYSTYSLYGYSIMTAYHPIRAKYCSIAVHILVALAWVGLNRDGMNPVVNHKDGNKKNNYYRNLEWTTTGKNNEHAITNDLRSRIYKCKVRDILTGEIKEFPSIVRLVEFLGLKCKTKSILAFKSVRVNRLYKGRYEVRLKGDDRPWFYPISDREIHNSQSRYIITVSDGDNTKVFNGNKELKEYYREYGISGNKVSDTVSILKDKFPDLVVTVKDQYNTSDIEVMNITDGSVCKYPTIQSISLDLNIAKSMVLVAVRSNGSKIIHGYRMRYSDSYGWNDVIDNSVLIPKDITVTHKDTNEIYTYPSLRAVASALNMDRSTVKRHLRNPKEGDVYIMKLVDESSPVT